MERTPGARGVELIVYLEDAGDNAPETARGRTFVTLDCTDSAGSSVIRARHAWPFSDTDGGTLDAHIHQSVPGGAEQVASCRLRGTRGPLRGEVTDAGIG